MVCFVKCYVTVCLGCDIKILYLIDFVAEFKFYQLDGIVVTVIPKTVFVVLLVVMDIAMMSSPVYLITAHSPLSGHPCSGHANRVRL